MKSILYLRPFWGINVNADWHGELGVADALPHTHPDLTLINAASISSFHSDVAVIDANARRISPIDWLNEDYSYFEVIVIKACAPTAMLDVWAADFLKTKYSEKPVFVCGHAVNIFKDSLSRKYPLLNFSGILEDLACSLHGIDRLTLNQYPQPNLSLINPRLYVESTGAMLGSVYGSRGCPFSCGYCPYHNLYGKGIQFRDPVKIVQDIECWYRAGASRLLFRDQFWGANKEHRSELLRLLAKAKFDINWTFETRSEQLTEELIGECTAAGADLVNFGVESFDVNVLSKYKRWAPTAEHYQQITSHTKNHGLRTLGFLIIGFPDNTLEDIYRNFKSLNDIGVDWMKISVYSPYPLSPDWEPQETGNIDLGLFKQFDNTLSVQVSKHLSNEKLNSIADMFHVMYALSNIGIEHAVEKNEQQQLFRSRVHHLNDLYKNTSDYSQLKLSDELKSVSYMKVF
jgi:radical SAM superfamily enzyme YgiQ (UPF0313 family)